MQPESRPSPQSRQQPARQVAQLRPLFHYNLIRCGRVIYIGTFSKMLMPGLRVGYLVADGPIFRRLAHCKRVHDLTTTLMQRTLDEYVTVGRYQAHCGFKEKQGHDASYPCQRTFGIN